MAAHESSPDELVGGALALAAAAKPSEAGPSAAEERFGAHQVVRYATVEEAETYRRIMRVLYLEHRSFGLRLRPAQVADRLRDRYALTMDADSLESRLEALDRWGAVERDHDASLATTAAEWRRNRYTYDVTPAGRLTEELLSRLDALGAEVGRLDTARLPSIRDALARLVQELECAAPDGGRLRALLERLLAEVEALHVGALEFMRSLGELMRTVERIDDAEFDRAKGALLDHLQGFRQSRRRHSPEILALLDRIDAVGVEQLVGTIVEFEEFVALPGGAGVDEQRARRRDELLGRWRGLQAWFVGDERGGDSPWRTLNDQVIEAIRTVLAIAERLIERRSARVDRSAVLLHLAGRAVDAPAGEPTAWIRAAFGVRTPRHVGVPEEDPDAIPDRGRTSWRAAPPAPVVAYLRSPGAARPGRGRGAPVPDLAAGRRQLAARRARERAELEVLMRRMGARGPLRLSALARVDAHEFRHLLAWIGRAYETPPAGDGTRHAGSSDGRMTIALREPGDVRRDRVRLRVPHGTLELPDYEIEVRRR